MRKANELASGKPPTESSFSRRVRLSSGLALIAPLILSLAFGLASCGRDRVTVSDGGTEEPGGLPQNEIDLLRATYTAGFDTQSTIDDINSLMMRAIFFASCQNGNEPTVSGTVSEMTGQSGSFSWSPEPADKLRIIDQSGAGFDINFTTIEGNVGNLDCDDHIGFASNHRAVYQVKNDGLTLDLQSQKAPVDEFKTQVAQSVAGTLLIDDVEWTVQGQVTGTETYFLDISSGFSQRRNVFQIIGLFTSGNSRVETAQSQAYDYDSGQSITVSEQTDTMTASGTNGEVSFALTEVSYHWTDSNEREPIYEVSGRVVRNGADIGGFTADRDSGQVSVTLTDGPTFDL